MFSNTARKFAVLFCLLSLVLFFEKKAEAVVFIDFESGIEGTPGNYVFHSPDGDVFFNNQIDNMLFGHPLPDHTTGTGGGNFWHNTSADKVLNVNLSFDATYASIYVYGTSTTSYQFRVYDSFDNVLMDATTPLLESWFFVELNSPTPFRRGEVISLGAGDDLGYDDITIIPFSNNNATVPEPTSLLLVGSGVLNLFGVRFLRNRKLKYNRNT